jgi:uncharacterized membrane protein
MDEHMHKGKGWLFLILGVLLILNALFHVVNWTIFAGIIIVIAAVFMIAKHSCCKEKKK